MQSEENVEFGAFSGMPEQFHLVGNPFEMHERNLNRGFKSEFHVSL